MRDTGRTWTSPYGTGKTPKLPDPPKPRERVANGQVIRRAAEATKYGKR